MVLQPDADRRLHEPPTKRRRVEGLEQLGKWDSLEQQEAVWDCNNMNPKKK